MAAIFDPPFPIIDGGPIQWGRARDLDNDGDEDAVVWLVHQSGGSGSFYFLAAAIWNSGWFDGTTAVFIGDRIMPVDLAISAGIVEVLYRDRRTDAPMSDLPTIEATDRYELVGGRLIPVEDKASSAIVPASSVPGDDTPCAGLGTERAILETPKPGSRLHSPIRVHGCAVSAWFFEGEVRLRLLDNTGKTIAIGYAKGSADWMSRKHVPFEGSLSFEQPAHPVRGTLVVIRNNPSDDRTLDETLEVGVTME